MTLEKHVRIKLRRSRRVSGTTTCQTEWEDEYSYPTETVQVSDSLTLEE